MVPFDVQIADGDNDPHLADKLRAEMPGILAWAVRGGLDWQRQGLAGAKSGSSPYRRNCPVGGQGALEELNLRCSKLRGIRKRAAASRRWAVAAETAAETATGIGQTR